MSPEQPERRAPDGPPASGTSPADGAAEGAPVSTGVDGAADADIEGFGSLQLLDLDGAPPGTYGEFEPEHPPLIDGQGRVRLSFSRVDSYRNCPRKFRYSYVDRLPAAPGPHLSFGTSIHNALEAFYDRKLPACPSEEDLLGFLFDGWDTTGFAHLPRDEQLSFYRHAQDVLRRFHRREAAGYRLPMATEAWFELPIGYEATVVGSIDRVDVDDDGRFHVIDYKTNRKVKDRTRVAGSLQLAIYALACRHLYGSLPATVSLDFVVAGVTITVPIEDIDLEAARQAVLDTAESVREERYEPTPNRLCGWCDFRDVCPAWEGEGPELLGPAVQELDRLRRRVERDVRALRELEAGVARLTDEIDGPDVGEGGSAGAGDDGRSEPVSATVGSTSVPPEG